MASLEAPGHQQTSPLPRTAWDGVFLSGFEPVEGQVPPPRLVLSEPQAVQIQKGELTTEPVMGTIIKVRRVLGESSQQGETEDFKLPH